MEVHMQNPESMPSLTHVQILNTCFIQLVGHWSICTHVYEQTLRSPSLSIHIVSTHRRAEILSVLADLAKSVTEDKFDRRLSKLQASDAWKTNPKLAAYISNEWIPHKKMWAACYRLAYHGGINTNNHQESLNRVIKGKFLAKRSDQRMDSLLKMYWDDILPYYLSKYRNAQLTSIR